MKETAEQLQLKQQFKIQDSHWYCCLIKKFFLLTWQMEEWLLLQPGGGFGTLFQDSVLQHFGQEELHVYSIDAYRLHSELYLC